ncbi:hypothetical protein ACIPUD_10495 [Bradyrhizobium sp. CAR08]
MGRFSARHIKGPQMSLRAFMHVLRTMVWEDESKAAVEGPARDETERLRQALRSIVARTYSTDRRCRLGYDSVAEICDIATDALNLPRASEETLSVVTAAEIASRTS